MLALVQLGSESHLKGSTDKPTSPGQTVLTRQSQMIIQNTILISSNAESDHGRAATDRTCPAAPKAPPVVIPAGASPRPDEAVRCRGRPGRRRPGHDGAYHVLLCVGRRRRPLQARSRAAGGVALLASDPAEDGSGLTILSIDGTTGGVSGVRRELDGRSS